MHDELLNELFSREPYLSVGYAPKEEATFYKLVDGSPQPFTLGEITANKKVVIFGIPGAFTPTCSSTHLPEFEAMYSDFKGIGIDEIYCLCPNDPFVVDAWFKNLGVENVKPIPDGNLHFTIGENMQVVKDNLGFGPRTWRFAIVLDNGVITHCFIEDGKMDRATEDPFVVSSAKHVFDTLTA